MTPIAWTVLGIVVAALVGMTVAQAALARAARRSVGSAAPNADLPLPARGPALVYFHSPTCGPCRSVTPRIDALMRDGRPVLSVDVTRRPDIAQAFGVMATPTTVVVRDGRITDVLLGVLPQVRLDALLRET
jgi:thioredoxin 1